MTLDEYQNGAAKTALYPNRGQNLTYTLFGLCGEAGELSDKMAKLIRDRGGVPDDKWRQEAVKELGDVLWFLSQTAFELGVSLEEVAEINLKKLGSRMERGVIQGSGDNR
jgi:NTP pyrophosphatase (non-canonical NTP hydrolase)